MLPLRPERLERFTERRKGAFAVTAPLGAPRRVEAERFVAEVFAERYGARVEGFAPNLVLFEEVGRVIAVTGWRAAGHEPLFLERYLDLPIEAAMASRAAQPVARERIVEVGHLATRRAGGSVQVILALSQQLSRLGFEWVVFTATRELIGIFTRLGLPLLALAPADPERLGDEAAAWGTYYDSDPVVVAGRIRLALDLPGRGR